MADEVVTNVKYATEFIQTYQQEQSILRETVWTKGELDGHEFVFILSGAVGPAVQKGSNGNIPYKSVSKGNVRVKLIELYGNPVRMDGFNVYLSSVDERAQMQKDGVTSVNVTTDQNIIDVLETTTLNSGAAGPASLGMLLRSCAILDTNFIPDDGQRYGLLTPNAWAQMMKVPQFASKDYVPDMPFAKRTMWKDWNNVKWTRHPSLPGVGTNAAKCFVYHKSAVGHAIADGEMKPEIGFNAEHNYSWAHCRSWQGSVGLQTAGIVQINHNDDPTLI